MGKKYKKIAMPTIKRLPKYYECLRQLQAKERDKTSSKELSDILGFTPSQIRHDLNYFGGFGQQGYGYNVEVLYKEIEEILGVNRTHNIVIVGAGCLAPAIANYISMWNPRFNLKAFFSTAPEEISKEVKDTPVFSMDKLQEFMEKNTINIGIVCMEREFAQDVANQLIQLGITAIWNFSPIDLEVPDGVVVENMNLNNGLLTLSYFVSNSEKE